MLVSTDKVLNRANEIYRELSKGDEPEIRSRQVKAVAQALVEAINRELMNPIVVRCDDEEEGWRYGD